MTIRLHAPKGSEEYCYACGSYWTGSHSCPEIQNMLDDGFDGFGEVLFVERTLEEPAAPEPSVEQMIEEILSETGRTIQVHRIGAYFRVELFTHDTVGTIRDGEAQTLEGAVSALYRAWRERE